MMAGSIASTMGFRRAVLAAATLVLACGPAAAESLVADLSDHLVRITTGFTGSDVLLFGAIEGEGDVVVVVRGPASRAVVRQKERVAGVWINQSGVGFGDVPAFYAVAASRPLADFLPQAVAARHRIGMNNLHLKAHPPTGENHGAYREALLRNQVKNGLYPSELGRVTFLGKRLFRTNVEFPANVPTGIYRVEVYLIRDGQVASAQITPLEIRKAGLEAEIFDFAHRHEILYGLIAILLALMAGWGAGEIFRRT
jgi:uncharacterized protein (TIGR02186 family)